MAMHQQSITVNPRRLRVFICHANDHLAVAHNLYKKLEAAGFEPWIQDEKILPGQHRELEILKAVRNSDVVIICLSERSFEEAGYFQKIQKIAADLALKQPEGAIFLIPVRIENCQVPVSLENLKSLDLFNKNDYNNLIKALQLRASTLDLYPEGPKRNKTAPTTLSLILATLLLTVMFNQAPSLPSRAAVATPVPGIATTGELPMNELVNKARQFADGGINDFKYEEFVKLLEGRRFKQVEVKEDYAKDYARFSDGVITRTITNAKGQAKRAEVASFLNSRP